jgi:hypothetical protein
MRTTSAKCRSRTDCSMDTNRFGLLLANCVRVPGDAEGMRRDHRQAGEEAVEMGGDQVLSQTKTLPALSSVRPAGHQTGQDCLAL